MTELIKITTEGESQTVSARDLHEFMQIKKHFTDWMKDQLERGLFEEGFDYQAYHQKVKAASGSSSKIDYALTIDCAKEIAMLSNTDKGKEVRKYFIACEKRLRTTDKVLSPAEQLVYQAQLLVDHERHLSDLDKRVLILEDKTSGKVDNYTITGYANIKRTSVTSEVAKQLGKKASKMCQEKGLETGIVPDEKWGKLRLYPKEVLEIIFNRHLGIDGNY